jgi:uncharacterized protein (TIGR02118 family)
MIKMVYTWKDNPALTPAQCEEHYREVHMELARQAYRGAPGFRALRYNRVRRHLVNDFNSAVPREEPSDIDAFVELYFDDRASLERAFERPELSKMFDDHENFMAVNTAANVHIYEVDETTILEA